MMHKLILSIVMTLTLISMATSSWAKDRPYQIIDKHTLQLFGKKLTTSIPLSDGIPKNENNTDVSFSDSPDKVYVVAIVTTARESEFYLFNKHSDKVISLNFEQGPNYQFDWLNDNLFTVMWGGKDYSITKVFDANKNKMVNTIDNLIQFFPEDNYYVSYIAEGVKIGCIDSYVSKEEETVDILDNGGAPIRSWMNIDSVSKVNRGFEIVISSSAGPSTKTIATNIICGD